MEELDERLEAGGHAVDRLPDRPTVGDWLVTVALASVPVTGYLLLPSGTGRWDLPAWVGGVLLLPQLLPLAWRRVAPEQVMSIVGYATGGYFLLGFGFPYIFNAVGVIAALYAEAAYTEQRRRSIASLLISLGFVASIAIADPDTADLQAVPTYAFSVFVFVTAWATGDAYRSRRLLTAELRARAADAERRRMVEAETAVLAERTRIARELHDLIAHTVSVMVVQAGAGRRVQRLDPDASQDAFAAIEATGRAALTELRRLVTVLREGDEGRALAPQPGLAAVSALVGTLVDAGLPVRLSEEGATTTLPPSVDLTAYRIVQEAVTNVLKHAGEVRDVHVVVRRLAGHVEIEVLDDGRGAASVLLEEDADGTRGSGLVGMRERVGLFGGHVDAGPRHDGGFRVRATIPVAAEVDDPGVTAAVVEP